MNAVARFALVVMVTAVSATHVCAEEPRVNDGWTKPWKLMTVECVRYVDTVAQRITLEWRFVPFQVIGLFTVSCAIPLLGIYLGARLQDRDIRRFRRIRAAMRAMARRRGIAIPWTNIDPVRTRCFFWFSAIVTGVFYLLWILEASEGRAELPDSVRIKSSPRLIADWWWVCFWSSIFLPLVQGVRWFLLCTNKALKRDLTDAQEALVLAEDTI